MTAHQRLRRIWGQSLAIALPLLCLVNTAAAQFVWQIEDTTPKGNDFRIASLSCHGFNCTACGYNRQRQAPYRTTLLFRHSVDGGRSWVTQDPGILLTANYHTISVDQVDSVYAYAVADSAIILKTINAGASWIHLSPPITWTLQDLSFSDSLNGIVHSIIGTLITTDGGGTWDTMRFPGKWIASCHSYGPNRYSLFSEIRPERIFSTNDRWHSMDSGSALPDSSNDGNQFFFGACYWLTSDTIAAIGVEYVYDSLRQADRTFATICYSYDSGKTWNEPWIDSLDTGLNCMSNFYGNAVFCANSAAANILNRSTDRGMTWQRDSLGFLSPSHNTSFVMALAIPADGAMIAAMAETPFGENSFLAKQVPTISSVRGTALPSYFVVMPNPATSVIVISAEQVDRIEICDLIGRNVANVPVNSLAPIDVSSLPRGIYVVRGYHKTMFAGESKLILY